MRRPDAVEFQKDDRPLLHSAVLFANDARDEQIMLVHTLLVGAAYAGAVILIRPFPAHRFATLERFLTAVASGPLPIADEILQLVFQHSAGAGSCTTT